MKIKAKVLNFKCNLKAKSKLVSLKTRQKAVAEKINQELPELAFLRQHAPPDEEEAENLEGWMKTLNLKASFKNSKAVAQSLKNLFEKTQSVEGKGDFSYTGICII